jgi:hypothetical protein
MAPTGWSPIRALAGAQPYEGRVRNFSKFYFHVQGTNHSAPRRAGRLESMEPSRLKLSAQLGSGRRRPEPELKKLRLRV